MNKGDKDVVSVRGLWKGTLEQQINMELVEIELLLFLHQDGNKVNGVFTGDLRNDNIPDYVKLGRKSESATNVIGEIIGNRFIHFTAAHPDPDILSFGSVILEIMPSGKLEGLTLSYSVANEQLIFTIINLVHTQSNYIHEFEHFVDMSAISKTPNVTFSAAGQWRGMAKQQHVGNDFGLNLDLVMQLDLKQDDDKLSGTSTIQVSNADTTLEPEAYANTQLQKVQFNGWLRNNRFLHLNYTNPDPDILQFGSSVFEVLNPSVHLSGMFLGFSPVSNKLVMGTAHLDKRLTFDQA